MTRVGDDEGDEEEGVVSVAKEDGKEEESKSIVQMTHNREARFSFFLIGRQ